MEEIEKQVAELGDSWTTVHDQLAGSDAWQPHLPNCSLEQVGEVIGLLRTLMEKVRAPSGFSAGFHVAKSVAATALPPAQTALDQLAAGQLSHFPSLVSHIVRMTTALQMMVSFSEADEAGPDLTAKMAEGLALLQTAQGELASKKSELEASEEVAESVPESAKSAQQAAEAAAKAQAEAEENAEAANTELENIQATRTELDASNKRLETLLSQTESLSDSMQAESTRLNTLATQAQAHEKLIKSLLPGATSAGLAAAFADRRSMFGISKYAWMALFILSMGLLAWFGHSLTELLQSKDASGWQLLYRLPVAAPLIWVGWFSAIQYGNVVRLEEDYAFKEATSKAFAGYRDHLEHLAHVEDEDEDGNTESALDRLTNKTIDILAHEPLRVFGKVHRDASPDISPPDRFGVVGAVADARSCRGACVDAHAPESKAASAPCR